MRDAVPRLDTKTMPWTPGEMPGLFTKMLSVDRQTGARTALQRIDPAFGYQAPTTAHYHPIDEEIFLLKGCFSFDGELWLERLAYCFHPADTVHGFRSQVAEESWFLSRVTSPLEFGFVEKPLAFKPYSRSGAEPERTISVIADPFARDWEDGDAEPKLKRLILSRHPRTGEGSMLMRIPAGWKSARGPQALAAYCEVFVLEGSFEDEHDAPYEAGCYSFAPPGTEHPVIASRDGALIYCNFGGALEFV